MEPTETTRALLSFIHSLFCKKQHPQDCTFYSDIELADCWELPDVVCWTALTELIKQRMHTDEKGLLDSIAKVHRYLEGLNNLSKAEQNLLKAILMEADLRVLFNVSSLQICNTISFEKENEYGGDLETDSRQVLDFKPWKD